MQIPISLQFTKLANEMFVTRLANVDDLKLKENYPRSLWNGDLPNIVRSETEGKVFRNFIKAVKMLIP